MTQKAPAMQFYVKDWLSDEAVGASTLQTQGLWMRILCLLFLSTTRGELTRTHEEWCRMTGCSRRQFDEFLTEARALLFCYEYEKVTGVIMIRSRRMWRDDKARRDNALRQATYREKQKGKGAGHKIVTPSSALALAIATKKEQDSRTSKEDATPAILLARYLLRAILDWKPNFRKPTKSAFKLWTITMDRLLRLDGRTVPEVEATIDWATKDVRFWQANILSAPKLRKQFDVLEAQMARQDATPPAEVKAAEFERIERERYEARQRKVEVEQAEIDALTPEEQAEKARQRKTILDTFLGGAK